MEHSSPAPGQWRDDYSKEYSHKSQGASKVQPLTLVVEKEFDAPTNRKSEWFSGVDTMAAKLRETQRMQGKNLVTPTPCSKMKVESHLEKLM